ncbi:endothelial lipase [Caerostris extrusa]|uniref:Endothelial lipase n=1 Tax=Caerostris extrusa TaxID=172846 RepID=A0AAV4QTJ9_CAEEX|nr:endothelial lipase [Caerostris extrusa]
MAMRFFLFVTLLTASEVLKFSEAGIIGDIGNIIKGIVRFIVTSVEQIAIDIFNPPKSNNDSIQYLLYTPDSPDEACHLEPRQEALEKCPFNSSYPLKILIHGFLVTLNPKNRFLVLNSGSSDLYVSIAGKKSISNDDDTNSDRFVVRKKIMRAKFSLKVNKIKTRMLELYDYNVIIVNYTSYNQPPYILAAFNTEIIGNQVADLIKFLEKYKGVDPKNMHLIGFSLGAQVAGQAGKNTPNLARITGLDPAAPLFSFPINVFHTLKHTDADFVDVIHTSTFKYGYGMHVPVGNIDFYPNGGVFYKLDVSKIHLVSALYHPHSDLAITTRRLFISTYLLILQSAFSGQ